MGTLSIRAGARPRRLFGVSVALALGFLNVAGLAHGNITINATYNSSITSDPNAATIEASINSMISRLEAAITNPITVAITYGETGSGLGQSSTFVNTVPYGPSTTAGTYLNALTTKQSLSANDTTAIASLGNLASTTTPVPVSGGSNNTVQLTTPLLRALGFAALGNTGGQPDSTILLNMSIINISRSGSQNPSFYDLQAVAGHETDEVLGVGGSSSALPTTNSAVGAMDLYRYSGPGVRSFTTSTSAAPYFSIDGGTTDIVHFNQAGGGSDYADWGDGVSPADGHGNSPPQVQDAFGTPGVDSNVGVSELTGLDVVGYNLAPVPEPGAMMLTAVGLAAAAFVRRRRTAAVGAA